MTIRTRFAPSPTGYLHIGGARTALFAWLFAKKMQGQFVLRVEDTDRERSTDEAIHAILEGMSWLGLDFDEGPFYQTQRMTRYQEVIQQLLQSGLAYRCHCSKERLEQLRTDQMAQKLKPKYDGHCRDKNCKEEGDFVIRFANPIDGTVEFHDLIRGDISVANAELDDVIIQRTDGSPTYNFCVVIDDWDMQITHVIRGDDHINNTPRQINILNALNAPLPHYAHVPMIFGSDGKRLSKRHGATSVLAYRDEGFLPEALLNALVRLGWSHGDQEVFSLTEMIDNFSLQSISRSPAIFNPEKLTWMNQQYLKQSPIESLVQAIQPLLETAGVDFKVGPELAEVISVLRDRAKTLNELASESEYFFRIIENYDANAIEKHITSETALILQQFSQAISQLSTWDEEAINAIIKNTCEEFTIKMPKLAQPLRIALTGTTRSLGVTKIIWLFGQDKTTDRINTFLAFLKV